MGTKNKVGIIKKKNLSDQFEIFGAYIIEENVYILIFINFLYAQRFCLCSIEKNSKFSKFIHEQRKKPLGIKIIHPIKKITSSLKIINALKVSC